MVIKNSFRTALITSLAVAVLWGAAIRFGLLKHLPWFACEGFGCMGSGLLIMLVQFALIPLLFTIFGFICTRSQRAQAALTFGGTSFVMMLGLFAVLAFLNQSDIAAGERAAADACRQYPQLCPSAPPQPGANGH